MGIAMSYQSEWEEKCQKCAYYMLQTYITPDEKFSPQLWDAVPDGWMNDQNHSMPMLMNSFIQHIQAYWHSLMS